MKYRSLLSLSLFAAVLTLALLLPSRNARAQGAESLVLLFGQWGIVSQPWPCVDALGHVTLQQIFYPMTQATAAEIAGVYGTGAATGAGTSAAGGVALTAAGYTGVGLLYAGSIVGLCYVIDETWQYAQSVTGGGRKPAPNPTPTPNPVCPGAIGTYFRMSAMGQTTGVSAQIGQSTNSLSCPSYCHRSETLSDVFDLGEVDLSDDDNPYDVFGDLFDQATQADSGYGTSANPLTLNNLDGMPADTYGVSLSEYVVSCW